MKLKIKNKTGNGVCLQGLKDARFFLPYLGDRILRKVEWDVLDYELGIIEISVDKYHKSGLNVGIGQTFTAELVFADRTLKVEFPEALNIIESEDGTKSIIDINEVRRLWRQKRMEKTQVQTKSTSAPSSKHSSTN